MKPAELQKLIDHTSTQSDALHRICARAREVAGASGVAVAVVRQDQLVYEAGSGGAEGHVGRRVAATLSTSPPAQTRAEILRVEDADSDARIQSAICRQFGAKALLLLPLYRDHMLAGVLQVSFEQAHPFAEWEVIAYHELASAAEQAMFRASDPLAADRTAGHASCQASTTGTLPLVASPQLHAIPSTQPQARSLPVFAHLWDAAIALTIVIACAALALNRDRASDTSPTSIAMPPSSAPVARDAPTPPAPAASASPSDAVAERTAVLGSSATPSRKRSPRSTGHVEYFGDDVTVRRFAPEPAVLHRDGTGEVRRRSDDVTVRYFPAQ